MRTPASSRTRARSTASRGLAPQAVLPAGPAPDSRERLLHEAAHLFLSNGFQGVGIAEICTGASVQKGTFYHFFESKTHLLLEVIARQVAEINQSIERIAGKDTSAARKIAALFAMGQPAAGERSERGVPPGTFLGNIVLELSSQNPPVQAATRAAFANWIKLISKIVDQLIREEHLIGLDPEDAAEAVLGILQGSAVMSNAYNDPRKMRAFAHMALTLLRAIGAKPGAASNP